MSDELIYNEFDVLNMTGNYKDNRKLDTYYSNDTDVTCLFKHDTRTDIIYVLDEIFHDTRTDIIYNE